MTMEVFAVYAPHDDLPSIEPRSLIAISYASLLKQGDFDLVRVHDGLLSPNGELPFLQVDGQAVPYVGMLRELEQASAASSSQRADSLALHAFLDDKVLPLILLSLYSLPHNYAFVRKTLAANIPAPARFYRPEQFRLEARRYVETRADYWGHGGDLETDEDVERKRRRVLLETNAEAWKERRELEQREARERMKRAFGENKVVEAAQAVFASLEAVLASSKTSFLLSSEEPTLLDAHLAALSSLALFLPLPQPLLADSINASFPRIWTHANLMRRQLFSQAVAERMRIKSPPKLSLSNVVKDFTPSALSSLFASPEATKGREKKKSAEEAAFERKRRTFALVVAVGIAGWALGTGALPIPFMGRKSVWARLRQIMGEVDDEEFELVVEEDDDEDDEELDEEDP